MGNRSSDYVSETSMSGGKKETPILEDPDRLFRVAEFETTLKIPLETEHLVTSLDVVFTYIPHTHSSVFTDTFYCESFKRKAESFKSHLVCHKTLQQQKDNQK